MTPPVPPRILAEQGTLVVAEDGPVVLVIGLIFGTGVGILATSLRRRRRAPLSAFTPVNAP